MAAIFNDQRVLGIRLLGDGAVLHNDQPVVGVREVAPGVVFQDNSLVLGVDVLSADKAIHNDQPVIGVVLIEDRRDLYNDLPVVPVHAVHGSFNGDTGPLTDFTVYANSSYGDTGYYHTIYGSISGEPLPEFPLLEFATRHSNYTQVAFTGDCVSIVSGWRPVIPGTTLGDPLSDWAYDGKYTSATWSSEGDMVVGRQYKISWERTEQ